MSSTRFDWDCSAGTSAAVVRVVAALAARLLLARRRRLVAAAAAVVVAVVDVLVEGLGLVAVLDQRIDLLGRHAAVGVDEQRVGRVRPA